MAAPEYVIVGRVRKAHGIRGEVVVEALTDDPVVHFAVGGRLVAGARDGTLPGDATPGARELTIRRATPFKGGWIVRFAEIADRTAAEQWRERYLLVPATDLAPLAPGEIYYHELVGLTVELGDGTRVGRVEAFYEVPQGLLLEVGTDRGAVMLPYRPELVLRVDVERRALVVNPPVGMFE